MRLTIFWGAYHILKKDSSKITILDSFYFFIAQEFEKERLGIGKANFFFVTFNVTGVFQLSIDGTQLHTSSIS
jgi:hypothetical protein